MTNRIDVNWFNTDTGVQIINSIKHNGKLKHFGLLEKPALSAPYSQYEEINFKIMLVGKSYSGKTAFIDTLCQSKANSSSLSTSTTEDKNYNETPGIHITHLYWPVKMMNDDKFYMFNLGMWDVGKLASTKYEYILPSSTENLNCFIFIFSWTDKQSFLEVYEAITQIYNSNENEQKVPKLIIGTKFDQIVHSDIEQEMIAELEQMTQSKILRFSSIDCSFDEIRLIMNRLCEVLWEKDQRFKSVKK